MMKTRKRIKEKCKGLLGRGKPYSTKQGGKRKWHFGGPAKSSV